MNRSLQLLMMITVCSALGCVKADVTTSLPSDHDQVPYPNEAAFSEAQVAEESEQKTGAHQTEGAQPSPGRRRGDVQKLSKYGCALFLNHGSTHVVVYFADERRRELRPIALRPGQDAEVRSRIYFAWVDPEEVKIIRCRNRYEVRDGSIFRLVAQ